jgi:hypothetical protein
MTKPVRTLVAARFPAGLMLTGAGLAVAAPTITFPGSRTATAAITPATGGEAPCYWETLTDRSTGDFVNLVNDTSTRRHLASRQAKAFEAGTR